MKQTLFPAAFAALAATVLPPLVAQDRDPEATLDRVDEATVALVDKTKDGIVAIASGSSSFFGGDSNFGTGFVVDRERRLLLTSTDVVPARVREVRIRFADRSTAKAGVVARDNALSAVLLVAARMPESAKEIPLGASSEVRVGSMALTLGNPFQSLYREGEVAASLGHVSGIYEVRGNARYRGPVFEVDAAVNPGSFGGPLLDVSGRAIGVVSSGYSESRWLGTAIPIDPIRAWLERQASGAIDSGSREPPPEEEPEGAYLGVVVKEVEKGLLVDSFVAGSPAESTELKKGDILLQAGNQSLRTVADWERYLAGKRPGQQVRLAVLRDGKIVRVDVVLGSRFM